MRAEQTDGRQPMTWSSVDWTATEAVVGRIQDRIFRAAKAGDGARVKNLQKLLVRSRSAKLLAIRQVTQRNTALRVSAVVIARAESCGCPPGVVRGSACQAATASSVNHTVRLPRWRKAASYSAQFVTRRRCLGI